MEYLFLLRDGNNDGPPGPDIPERAQLFAAWQPVLGEMRAQECSSTAGR